MYFDDDERNVVEPRVPSQSQRTRFFEDYDDANDHVNLCPSTPVSLSPSIRIQKCEDSLVTMCTPVHSVNIPSNSSMPLSPAGVTLRIMDLYSAIENQEEHRARIILSTFDLLSPSVTNELNMIVPDLEMTLLHFAVGVSENSSKIINDLLQHGCDPNSLECADRTSPMHISVMLDFDNAFEELMKFGGDPKIRNGEGKSCYDLARDMVVTELKEKCFNVLLQLQQQQEGEMEGECRNSTISSDGFFSCDSQISPRSILADVPAGCTFLMTEDDTYSSDDSHLCTTFRKKLSTIPEEINLPSTPSSANNNKMEDVVSSPSIEDVVFPPSMEDVVSPPSMEDVLPPPSVGELSKVCSTNSMLSEIPVPTDSQLHRLQTTMRMKNIKLPVTPSTYPILQKYAQETKKLYAITSPKTGTASFSCELRAAIQDLNLVNDWGKHRIQFIQDQNTTPTSRTSKSFFNYILLDPKIIKRTNLSGNHLKSDVITSGEKFEKFLSAIFYIGKGMGKRPLEHLVEAKERLTKVKRYSSGEKLDKILEIWKAGQGVMVCSLFHHSSEREANVNEAAMIDAVGLVELSNLKKGSYSGTPASSWSQKVKNQFGSFLLYKSYCTFAVNDQKSFYPHDF